MNNVVIVIIIIILLCSDGFETRLKKFLLEDSITYKKKKILVVLLSTVLYIFNLILKRMKISWGNTSHHQPVPLPYHFSIIFGARDLDIIES